MMWHRRETRRQTEKTKLNLHTGSNLPTHPICLTRSGDWDFLGINGPVASFCLLLSWASICIHQPQRSITRHAEEFGILKIAESQT